MLWLFVSNCLNICKATMETLQSNSAEIQAQDVKIHKPVDFGSRSLKGEPDKLSSVIFELFIATDTQQSNFTSTLFAQDSQETKVGTRYQQKSAGSSWAHTKQRPNIPAAFSTTCSVPAQTAEKRCDYTAQLSFQSSK